MWAAGARLGLAGSTTVGITAPFCMRFAKVERLRQTDESIDAPIDVITAAVSPAVNGHEISFQTKEKAVLIEAIAAQVLDCVLELRRSDHRALVGTDPAQR
jgi:hypothetical protein